MASSRRSSRVLLSVFKGDDLLHETAVDQARSEKKIEEL